MTNINLDLHGDDIILELATTQRLGQVPERLQNYCSDAQMLATVTTL